MKGIICYYSGSGNTKLACEYIASRMDNIEFRLFNIVKGELSNLDNYDIVGFATFTDYWGPPCLMQKFIERLPSRKNKPAFVFATFGYSPGRLLKTFSKWVSAKGFLVVAGHALHTPESFPPMVASGRGYENSPSEKELKSFNDFISKLDTIIAQMGEGNEVAKGKMEISLPFHFLPGFSRTKAKRNMGSKFVDEALCNECGICEKVCPYNAITLNPKPVFDMNSCYGCWRCFNKCPMKAIYTKRFRGIGHYPKPNKELREKLRI
jgi:ferredoxin